LFVMLIPFFGFTELQRVLGEGRLEQMFVESHRLVKHLDTES